jgi:hypothetical protein
MLTGIIIGALIALFIIGISVIDGMRHVQSYAKLGLKATYTLKWSAMCLLLIYFTATGAAIGFLYERFCP